jgi:hypothetical protein
MKKVHPQVLFLCSMVGIGNDRLERLAFDTCHLIDLTCDYFPNTYKLVMKQIYFNVMPRIIHDIKSLRIKFHQISFIETFLKKRCNGTSPNLTHLEIILGAKHVKTSIPYTLGK